MAIALALNTGAIGLTASDVNIVTAVLVAIALYAPQRQRLRRIRRGSA
jgi:putative ABC transport system permease protein